ncbi:hypothetical protein ROHU_029058 [Labeo rohita]|uniref:Uncharacterized protein n=1 Tax=Labeo rohita TaxID=84645 RepID=A0A498LXP1_LABRO|nr:hypothetical protein ROHU_029058 [Labeo rohita]
MKTPETFGNTCEDVPAHRDDVRERDAAVYCTIARWRYEQSNKRNTMIYPAVIIKNHWFPRDSLCETDISPDSVIKPFILKRKRVTFTRIDVFFRLLLL